MQIDWAHLDPKKWWAAHRMNVLPRGNATWMGDCPWRGRHKQAESMATIVVSEEPQFTCPDSTCASRTFAELTMKWKDGWAYSQEHSANDDEDAPNPDDGFEPLGFTTDGTYMYQSVRTGHIVETKAGGHTEIGLYQLVPSGTFWRQYCGGDGGISWKKVARKMMAACHDKGYYMAAETRGAGMFNESQGRIVVNLGANLLVNDEGSDAFLPVHMANFRGNFNYATPRRLILPEPMGKEELDSILEIIKMMPWESDGDALVMAGAIVCGHVAGALHWRPHFWLTGTAGGGKSQILNLIAAALQPFPMYFEGTTSAAGIRDSIGNSSGLVIVDEMEKQGGSSDKLSSIGTVKRVDAIMEMMRSASSGSRAKVAKGGPDGKGFEVQFKCCALFGSIYYGVEMAQDYRRFCFMRLQPQNKRSPEQKEIYNRVTKPLLEKTFTPEFAMRLYSWAVLNSRGILNTIAFFKDEMLAFTKDAGEADQWSAVLGAAWVLTRYGESPTSLDVRKMYDSCSTNRKSMDGEIKEAAHSEQIFNALMQSKPQGEHMTIGAQIAAQRAAMSHGRYDDTNSAPWLAQHGVVVDGDVLLLCIGHKQLKRIMANEGYTDYRQAFMAREGVVIQDREVDFAGFTANRVIVVPLSPLGAVPRADHTVTQSEVERFGRQE